MTIKYNYETDFKIDKEIYYSEWINRILKIELVKLGNLSYIFCDDGYLIKINQEYLNHDTYTDIITFDYTEGKTIGGDIFISVERIKENAEKFEVEFNEELIRVMSHGILHLIGYKDKTDADAALMREKENQMIKLFHVEQ